MTAKETIKLAVLETKMEQLKSDLAEIRTHQTDNHHELATKIEVLIKHIDGKLGDHEKRLSQVEETTAPFSKFRSRLWTSVVFAALSIATVAVILLEVNNSK